MRDSWLAERVNEGPSPVTARTNFFLVNRDVAISSADHAGRVRLLTNTFAKRTPHEIDAIQCATSFAFHA
jgi:hypothetical protein